MLLELRAVLATSNFVQTQTNQKGGLFLKQRTALMLVSFLVLCFLK